MLLADEFCLSSFFQVSRPVWLQSSGLRESEPVSWSVYVKVVLWELLLSNRRPLHDDEEMG